MLDVAVTNPIPPANSPMPNVAAEIVALTPALRAFAKRFLKHPYDVDDIVQETMMKALTSIHQYRPGTSLKAWLFTILRNAFCTNYQRRKREPVGLTDDEIRVITPPAQEWAVMQSDLQRALKTLPEGSRKAFLLVTAGSSYEQAAELCECAVGTIKSRVSRARHDLETLLM